jgi:hypothetical protein
MEFEHGIVEVAAPMGGNTLQIADRDWPINIFGANNYAVFAPPGQVRLILGNTVNVLTLSDIWTTAIVAGARVRIIELSNASFGEELAKGLPYIAETWQDILGIDPTVWATALGGTGTVTWDATTEQPYHKVILAGPANGDTARLRSVQTWQCGPGTWGLNTIAQKAVFEWESRLVNVANIDNALFFMGLNSVALGTRASNDIAGFILTGDVLWALTDDGGGESLTLVAAPPVLTDWSRFKVMAMEDAIEFWINGVRVAQHPANLPDANMYGTWYMPNEAGAAAGAIHVGPNQIKNLALR